MDPIALFMTYLILTCFFFQQNAIYQSIKYNSGYGADQSSPVAKWSMVKMLNDRQVCYLIWVIFMQTSNFHASCCGYVKFLCWRSEASVPNTAHWHGPNGIKFKICSYRITNGHWKSSMPNASVAASLVMVTFSSQQAKVCIRAIWGDESSRHLLLSNMKMTCRKRFLFCFLQTVW